jgi:fructose-1,6-bisphosphatase/inositol monophosphatase family enzyme/ADP-ribosylglycohydrolase
MDLSRALEAAQHAARAAGALLLADFHRSDGPRGHVDKAEADVEAEWEIRTRLLADFPEWGYLGEETGRVVAPGAPVWLVDPNDGTRDYLVGRRGSAVSIGLVTDGRPVLGVVFVFGYPDDAGDLFAWAEGCGPLLRNGREITQHLTESLGPQDVVLVSSKGDRDPEGNLTCAAPARYRSLASIAHRLALVAAGEAAAATSLYSPCAWDYAAGHALLRGVQGALVDESGHEVGYTADGESRTRQAYGAARTLAEELARRPWKVPTRRGAPFVTVRLRRGEAIADPGLLSRAQGCLLAQVAGGSLGASPLLRDSGRLLAGQPIVGTEMALVLARALLAEDRPPGPEAALEAYREWYRTEPADVDPGTRAALGGSPMAESAMGDPLLRVAPLALYNHRAEADDVATRARQDAALTHPNVSCTETAAALAVALAHAIATGAPPVEVHAAALAWAQRRATCPGLVEFLTDAASAAPPAAADPASAPAVFWNAFFTLLHAESLEQGVRAAALRGRTAAALHGAVAGALLGAVHGRGAVPEQWRVMVLTCRAHPLRAAHPRPPACWPVDLLEIAERLLIAPSGR